jgi:hypothetical protein
VLLMRLFDWISSARISVYKCDLAANQGAYVNDYLDRTRL